MNFETDKSSNITRVESQSSTVSDIPSLPRRNTDVFEHQTETSTMDQIQRKLSSNFILNLDNEIKSFDIVNLYNSILCDNTKSCQCSIRNAVADLLLLVIIKCTFIDKQQQKSELLLLHEILLNKPELVNKYFLLYILVYISRIDWSNYLDNIYH
jgi:hypothetical protein